MRSQLSRTPPSTGAKLDLSSADLSLDPVDRKLLAKGRPLEAAYCVFSIRCTEQKADYGAIPELRTAWAAFKSGILTADRKQADAALEAFRRIVVVSPDLITRDKTRLIGKASKMKDAALPSGPGLVSTEGTQSFDLADVALGDLRNHD